MSTFDETFAKRWGTDDPEVIAHAKAPYDPVKAHEYYIRTRKLKGRQKKRKVPDAVKKEYQKKLTKFLGSLPMAVEGTDLKKTAAFVNRMRKMSDDEMVAEAKRIRKEQGNNDGAQVATINALLKNRARIRKQKGNKNPTAYSFDNTKRFLPPTKKTTAAAKSTRRSRPTPRVRSAPTNTRRAITNKPPFMRRPNKSTTQKLNELAARKAQERADRTG